MATRSAPSSARRSADGAADPRDPPVTSTLAPFSVIRGAAGAGRTPAPRTESPPHRGGARLGGEVGGA